MLTEEIWIHLIAMRGADFKTTKVVIAYTDCIAKVRETMITLATLCKARSSHNKHSKKEENLFHVCIFYKLVHVFDIEALFYLSRVCNVFI